MDRRLAEFENRYWFMLRAMFETNVLWSPNWEYYDYEQFVRSQFSYYNEEANEYSPQMMELEEILKK